MSSVELGSKIVWAETLPELMESVIENQKWGWTCLGTPAPMVLTQPGWGPKMPKVDRHGMMQSMVIRLKET